MNPMHVHVCFLVPFHVHVSPKGHYCAEPWFELLPKNTRAMPTPVAPVRLFMLSSLFGLAVRLLMLSSLLRLAARLLIDVVVVAPFGGSNVDVVVVAPLGGSVWDLQDVSVVLLYCVSLCCRCCSLVCSVARF